MEAEPTVFIVDDDQAIRDALQVLMESVGFATTCFSDGQDFLDGYHPGQAGCLVLDIRMPGMTGLDLQEQLGRRGIQLPVIIITGHGDVPMAVRALKNGAVDFLEKPFSDELLLQAVRRAVHLDADQRRLQGERSKIATRLAKLTDIERQMLQLLCDGVSNKDMGRVLEIGIKTVEMHRATLMEKMEARNLAELIRIAVAAGVVEMATPSGQDE